jgi:hypothetical protein
MIPSQGRAWGRTSGALGRFPALPGPAPTWRRESALQRTGGGASSAAYFGAMFSHSAFSVMNRAIPENAGA